MPTSSLPSSSIQGAGAACVRETSKEDLAHKGTAAAVGSLSKLRCAKWEILTAIATEPKTKPTSEWSIIVFRPTYWLTCDTIRHPRAAPPMATLTMVSCIADDLSTAGNDSSM
eukprot:scaffold910_cov396-Prasinococcus_capsulatus_cf.AAC.25